MDPDEFVQAGEIVNLTSVVRTFLAVYATPGQRFTFFKSTANIHAGFYLAMNLNDPVLQLSTEMAGSFRSFRVPVAKPDYHPLVSFIQAILSDPGLVGVFDGDQPAFMEQLLQRGKENLKAIRARTAVGRIESPLGAGLGTAAYVGKNMLLTCRHVFGASIYQAWVRFGYKVGSISLEEVHALDMNYASAQNQPDYALVRFLGATSITPLIAQYKILSDGEDACLRMIHHPGGRPAVVSDPGKIVQAGGQYIDHDIPTQPGSSGVPLFDPDWTVVAIHRGDPGIGRDVPPGTSEAVPVAAFWKSISAYLV